MSNMSYIPRSLQGHLEQLAVWFPVVSVTGPRQSGKSTLIRNAFSSYEYVNLEDPATRKAAGEDPVGFIRAHPSPLIIDEAQRVPDIFSAVQVASDERGTPGQYVILGSQNFLMSREIGQTLAGRVGLTTLLPFSYMEAVRARPGISVDAFAILGGYPRLIQTGMPAEVFYGSYLDTYVNRDVSGELDVRNLAGFRTFVQLCAQRAGGILNISRLASDAGVSFPTAKSWLSILQASSIIYLLPAYASNEGKRLTKSPKLYLCDTGLLCHLLHIRSEQELLQSEHLGAVVENLVVVEALKSHLNRGERAELYYYRDDSKREIDLIDLADVEGSKAIEIKAGETYRDRFALHLSTVGEELGFDSAHRYVAYRGGESFATKACRVVSLQELFTNVL